MITASRNNHTITRNASFFKRFNHTDNYQTRPQEEEEEEEDPDSQSVQYPPAPHATQPAPAQPMSPNHHQQQQQQQQNQQTPTHHHPPRQRHIPVRLKDYILK